MKQPDLCNLKMKWNLRGKNIVSKLFCKQKNIFFLIMSWPNSDNFSLECYHQRFHFVYIFYDNCNEKKRKKLSSLQHTGHASVYFTFRNAGNFGSILWRSQRSNNLIFLNLDVLICVYVRSLKFESLFFYLHQISSLFYIRETHIGMP